MLALWISHYPGKNLWGRRPPEGRRGDAVTVPHSLAPDKQGNSGKRNIRLRNYVYQGSWHPPDLIPCFQNLSPIFRLSSDEK